MNLVLFRAVDPVQSNDFLYSILEDDHGIAVEDGNDKAGELGVGCRGGEQEQQHNANG
jgi:hypothetical protein